MTPDETRILLGEIAAIDNRKMTTDTAQTWHQLLAGFSLNQCRDALATFRRNRPDDWLVPGHIAQIINRNIGTATAPRCTHGVPIGAGCHDCAHPDTCPLCYTPDPQAAAVKRVHRANWAIVYPGETHCLDGHDQAMHKPITTNHGHQCGHPDHHTPTPEW